MLRYIERNPLRAGMVKAAERWPWSSLRFWQADAQLRPVYLHKGPVARGNEWVEWVNQMLMSVELERVRHSVIRGTPYGGSVE